jgi:hypothetical protein
MAQTAHIPSFIQAWNSPLDFYIKPEKFAQQLQDDDTFTNWLNVDHLPSMNATTSTSSSVSASTDTSSVAPTVSQNTISMISPSQGSAFSAVKAQSFFPTQVTVQPIMNTSQLTFQNYQSSFVQPYMCTMESNPGLTLQYTYNTGAMQSQTQQQQQVNGSAVQSTNQLQSAGFTAIQLPQFVTQSSNSQQQQQQQFNSVTLQAVSPQAQLLQNQIMLTNFGFPSQQQPVTIVPQFYNLLTQFQAPSKPVATEDSEDRKRKSSNGKHQRPKRQTRPKVVEAKGAVQCKGKNRKKSAQCRNAALMEYIGPRPIYCAEHIELDPNSLYEKCKSSYQKEVGDKKGCKEVVLKEFGYCYKHFGDILRQMLQARDIEKIRKHYDRICELLAQLERDAAAAKKKDGDLFQRKNKLIPKFQEMKKLLSKGLEEQHSLHEVIIFSSHELNAPVLNLSNDDDDDNIPVDDAMDASLKNENDATAGQSPFSDLDASRFDQLS